MSHIINPSLLDNYKPVDIVASSSESNSMIYKRLSLITKFSFEEGKLFTRTYFEVFLGSESKLQTPDINWAISVYNSL